MADQTDATEPAQYAEFDHRYQRHDDRFGVKRASLATVPVIDLSPFVRGGDEAARSAVAQQIRTAAIDIGFFYLTGHGFSAAEMEGLLAFGHRFFALPEAEKAKVHWNNSPGKGYIPPGGINAGAKADATADQKARLYFSREFATDANEAEQYPSDSQWPDEHVLPGFRPFVTAYTRKGVALGQSLGRAFARSLGLPERHFVDHMGRVGGVLVYNYYPHLDRAALERAQWSFSPHTDYGSFTILLQDQSGGLQVRNSNGEWIDVTPMPGALIVNIGDMLAMVTNDLYTSNLHRVLNFSGQERMSVSLFFSPPAATTLSCLETCSGPGNPPLYAPVNAGDYHRMLMDQYHRTGRPGIAGRTAERLQAS